MKKKSYYIYALLISFKLFSYKSDSIFEQNEKQVKTTTLFCKTVFVKFWKLKKITEQSMQFLSSIFPILCSPYFLKKKKEM